ncbi:hypothetical protein M9H77_34557 [Catharanthus roseus]|uniref:Uncharacterized protein n=1 Tax=Catharanthus roseus TaxID=4058 RepID=A0ACB9ZNN0_CATRO|nr:hypothetical protein M9H77_34557 [Catharanthus roseus]
MSKTEGFVVLETESNKASLGDKPNVEKEKKTSFGNIPRKKLADISNLPQQARVSITTKEYIEQLKKENLALLKILAERNKIIEVTGIELQKMRVNIQKLQQQNLQLAQSNNQMLADLNSGKDRLKVLQHELGCKNGLLRAKKLEIEERLKAKQSERFDDELELFNCDASKLTKVSSKIDGDNGKCGNTRRPKSKSLDPRQVQSKDDIENKGFVFSYHYQVHGFILKSNSTFFPNCGLQKNVHKDISILNRQCLRRRSARIRSEEIKPPSDVFETEDTKISTCFPSIEDDPPRENGSASASVPVQDEGTKHAPRHEAANKRPCVQRQSARFKSEEPKPCDDSFQIAINDGALLKVAASEIQDEAREGKDTTKQEAGTKRHCVRRQSARFKSEELKPKPSDASTINDDDSLMEDVPSSTCLSLKIEDNKLNPAPDEFETIESKRSSLSRPSRQAAKKVHSYKEIPINIKMRRPQ